MFDLSWTEILVIGVTAIVFIGPKELPGALRTVGKMVAKARGMAREFQTSVDDMVRDSEIDELKQQVKRLEYGGLEREIEAAIDPKGELKQAMTTPSFDAATESSASPAAPATPAPVVPAAAAPAIESEAPAASPTPAKTA